MINNFMVNYLFDFERHNPFLTKKLQETQILDEHLRGIKEDAENFIYEHRQALEADLAVDLVNNIIGKMIEESEWKTVVDIFDANYIKMRHNGSGMAHKLTDYYTIIADVENPFSQAEIIQIIGKIDYYKIPPDLRTVQNEDLAEKIVNAILSQL